MDRLAKLPGELTGTELVLPTGWDNVAIAQGQLRASVTYTYTPATDLGPQLPAPAPTTTGSSPSLTIAVLLGLTAVLAARRRRASV